MNLPSLIWNRDLAEGLLRRISLAENPKNFIVLVATDDGTLPCGLTRHRHLEGIVVARANPHHHYSISLLSAYYSFWNGNGTDRHQPFLNTATPLLLAPTSTSDHLAHWRKLPPLLELFLCRTLYLQRLGQSHFTLEKKAAYVAFSPVLTAVHLRSSIDKRRSIPSR